MKFPDIFGLRKADQPQAPQQEAAGKARALQPRGTGSASVVYHTLFDGEKNMGGIGPLKDYHIDPYALRMRSWEAELTNEIAHTILDKFTKWVIGQGLSLKSNPEKGLLKAEGIAIDTEKFNDQTETRWTVYAKSTLADYKGQTTFNNIMSQAFRNAIIGGDVLVILRVENGIVKVELKDGQHVQTPGAGTDYYPKDMPAGVTIRNGVEIDARGRHTAYHIRTRDFKYTRIPAYTGNFRTAFLIYGREHRLDNSRGIPLINNSLETLAALDRYKEATVQTAEERAKVAFQIVHGRDSTGESPLASQLAKAYNADMTDNENPVDSDGDQLANKVAVTTNKSVFNNTQDSEIKPLQIGESQLYFKDFIETNINIIAASIGIPPNVAMSLYNDSFSASRAATKDWEHTLKVVRSHFASQFLQPIYALWLFTNIMRGKIDAPGYIQAFNTNNEEVLNAYYQARWNGEMFPHIDPLKEVNAERAKLGPLGANMPLTTVEQATEALSTGDSDSNMEQFADELKIAESLDLYLPEIKVGPEGMTRKKAAEKETED